MSPRSRSTSPVRSGRTSSWIRPERSTRSRKTSFPRSRRAITRPAIRRVSAASCPASSASASRRTDAISARPGNRLGREAMAGESSPGAGVLRHRRERALPVRYERLRVATPSAARLSPKVVRLSRFLGCFDLEDLVLQLGAAGSCDLDRLALLLPDDRPADRRLVGELVLRRIRLGGADDVVLDRLFGGDVAQADVGADADDVLRDLLLVDHARGQQALLELSDAVLEHRLLVLGVVVLGVLGDVSELACDPDAIGDLAPLLGREVVDLFLQLLVTLGGEDHFFHRGLLVP